MATAISGCPSMSHLSVDTFFEFGVVENFVHRAIFTVIFTSDLFGCMSDKMNLTVCSTSSFSVILKMYKYCCLYSCLVVLLFSVSNI